MALRGDPPGRGDLRHGRQLGTIGVGKLADLIVVGGNPLEDIDNVRRLQLVLKDGAIVSDKRDPFARSQVPAF